MTKTIRQTNRATKALTAKGQATAPRKRRQRRPQPKPVDEAPSTPAPEIATSKQAKLAALLVRDEGATLEQMIALTGWLPHTTRAALAGLRKKEYAIDSDKVDGVRTYRAVAPE